MARTFKRGQSWGIDYTDSHGNRHRKMVGSQEQATEALEQATRRVFQAGHGVIDNEYPFDDLADLYMRHHKVNVRPSTYKRSQIGLKQLRRMFGERRISKISLDDIDTYREQRLCRDGRTPRAVNIETGLLGRILRFGVDRKLIASSPIAKAKPLKETPKKRRRALTPREAELLLEYATAPMRPVWLCFLKTGLRRGELVGLRWRNVDFDGARIRLDPDMTKTGEGRTVPIAPDLLIELRRLRLAAKSDTEHIFCTRDGRPRKNNLLRQLRGTLRRAGVDTEGVDIHALRYTFITQLLRQRVNPRVVQALAGHKTLAVTMGIYAQVFDEDRVSAIAELTYEDEAGWHKSGTVPKGVSQVTGSQAVG